MPGRLGIDFGASNTVLAVWDPARGEGVPLHISEFGTTIALAHGPEEAAVSVIPTLIHYAEDGRRWIGEQVRERGLEGSERTFSLIKQYLLRRSPVQRKLGDRRVSPMQAGADFLSAVLVSAAQQFDASNEEVALTVPVEAFEHYSDWLTGTVEQAGMPRIRLLDEPSAAALGYGAHIQPGQAYFIFDFGGGTLDVAMVLIEEPRSNNEAGRHCRVLGKSGRHLGGSSIDAWLMQDFLRRHSRNPDADEVRRVSRALLSQCRQAKETLSREPSARVSIEFSGAPASFDYTPAHLEELLDEHDAFTQIDQTIRRTLHAAHEHGFGEDRIDLALLIGGSSLMPCVQKAVTRIFGREKVRLHRPLDAVARGAAAFVAGAELCDHIQHDYAVRWLNPRSGEYDYRVVVQRGTVYPTREPLARMTVKATHAGQTELGIAIFELGDSSKAKPLVELVFDPSGAARLVELTLDEQEQRTRFWVNEQNPTFLSATLPSEAGEPRFAVEFGVDANKRLLITARDLKTGSWVYRDHPVVKLS